MSAKSRQQILPRLSRLQEPQIERPEHQNYSDVHHQPLPEPVPEKQDIHADHDGYQREHVKHNGCLPCIPSRAWACRENSTKSQHRNIKLYRTPESVSQIEKRCLDPEMIARTSGYPSPNGQCAVLHWHEGQ